MTPRVSSAIEAIDAERLAVAGAFGIEVRSVQKHFSQSFEAEGRLRDIAAELHKKRGGPPGPTRIDTRYLSEDVPYGLGNYPWHLDVWPTSICPTRRP